jgi:peptidoglycan/xylan/chitin deacetylase (PgdA/CDA1 family)
MKALHDSGYQTISADELYQYLFHDAPLPSKPILITFDDTRAEQFTLAVAEMNKYHFKGVFFIMTVSIGKPGYMTKNQIKILSQTGHTIGLHTWDHTAVTRYVEKDWEKEVIRPRKQLENLIGKPVDYFSYPFGLWNQNAISKLKTENFKLAFILSSAKDKTNPEFTVRRKTIAGTWSTPTMLKVLLATFH